MLVLDDDDLCTAVRGLKLDYRARGRHALYDVARRNVQALGQFEALRAPLRFAYSVKTNPDRALLEMFCDAGLYAEVISPEELTLALSLGFGLRTIYNGPHPAWRAEGIPGIVFSDSAQSFAENARRLEGTLVGIRVRPPGIQSRFGVGEDELRDVYHAIRSTGRRSVGVSMHVRPQDFRGRRWREVVAGAIELARAIERHARTRVTAFDVGGGNTPVEFDRALASGDFAWLLREVTLALPYTNAVFAEPGQAIVTPTAVFVAPVLEIRRHRGRTDVVVDAGYPELPQVTTFPHRVLAVAGDDVRLLGEGRDRILGRTCLEYDILRDHIRLPSDARALQAVVIADVGAYDASMGFDFARGGNRAIDEWNGVEPGRELPASHSRG